MQALRTANARFSALRSALRGIARSVSSPSRTKSKRHPFAALRVAVVADTFTESCLAPEVTLLPLDARTYKVQLAAFAPDLVLVESAWRGHAESWKRRIASYPGVRDDTLAELVRHCRRRSIPTVFWNKEDPTHFDRFIDAASLFDVVLTTAEERVEAYRERGRGKLRHVGTMMFAAQPTLHHPDGGTWDQGVCFAGSFGEAALADRRKDVLYLLAAAAKRELTIYDRNLGSFGGAQSFPAEYARFVRPPVPYAELVDIYRRHRVVLNVNSVVDSRTMFSRRVFEAVASGAPVLSNASTGIRSVLGDIVSIASDEREAEQRLTELLDDSRAWQERAAAGIRAVHTRHTYVERLDALSRLLGLGVCAEPLRCALVASCGSAEDVRHLADIARAQSVRPAELFVLARGELDAERVPEVLRGAGLDAGVHIATSRDREDDLRATQRFARESQVDYVACFDIQRRSYGPEALASLLACTRFSDADLIAPPSDDAPFVHHRHSEHVLLGAVLLERSALARVGWSDATPPNVGLRDAYRSLNKYAADRISSAARAH